MSLIVALISAVIAQSPPAQAPAETASPEPMRWIGIDVNGLKVATGPEISIRALPLPRLPRLNIWLDSATEAGLDIEAPEFSKTVEEFFAQRMREATEARQRRYQTDFNRACGMEPAGDDGRDVVLYKLKARVLRDADDELRASGEAWVRAITAAAEKAGIATTINDQAVAASAARMWREDAREALTFGLPGPVPRTIAEDLEAEILRLPPMLRSKQEVMDFRAEYRANAQLEISKMLKAGANYHAARIPGAPNRGGIVKAMDEMVDFEISSADKLADVLGGAAGEEVRVNARSRMLTVAVDVCRARADIANLQTQSPYNQITEIGQLQASLTRAESAMLKIQRDAWTRFLVEHRIEEGVAGQPRFDQLRSARAALIKSIDADMRSLVASQMSKDPPIVHKVASLLARFGSISGGGEWTPASMDNAWPGDFRTSR